MRSAVKSATGGPARPMRLVAPLVLAILALVVPAGAVSARTSGSSPAAATSVAPRATAPAGSAIVPGSVDRTSIDLRATYDVSASVAYGTRRLATNTLLTVTNTSGAGIDRLELNTIAARLGGISLTEVTVDGGAVEARISGQTVIVPLGGVLPADATAAVRVRYRATYRATLGGSDWLFSQANGIINSYRWIPWVSRVRTFERPNHGDPFFTPVSPSVRVRISSDRELRYATSGRRVAVDGLTQTFEATNVRDFNFAASPSYSTISGTSGDTTVRVFYRGGSPSTMLTWAREALADYERLVGEYPYPTFNVAQSAGGYAMESPALIWIPYGVASSSIPYLVAHETAHQWFYGTVGNDQANQPWADEAPADFLTRYTLGSRRASNCATTRLDLSIYSYGSCYYEIIYIQGGNFLDDMRRDMGSAAFWTAMREYYRANRFELSTTKRLLDTLRRYASFDPIARYRHRFPKYY